MSQITDELKDIEEALQNDNYLDELFNKAETGGSMSGSRKEYRPSYPGKDSDQEQKKQQGRKSPVETGRSRTEKEAEALEKINKVSNDSLELDLEDLEKVSQLKKDGLVYYRKKMYLEALNLFEKATTILPGDLELLYYEALCLYHLKNLERALTILKQLHELDEAGSLRNLPRLLALVYLKMKDYDRALEHLKAVRKIRPDDVQILSMLGYALERLNELDEAVPVLKKALEIDETNANAANSLAYVYTRQKKNFQKAHELISLALRKEPDNPAYLDTLGMLLFHRGNATSARQALKKALKIAPKNSEILNHLSEILNI